MTNCNLILVRPMRFHITLALLIVASGLLAAPANDPGGRDFDRDLAKLSRRNIALLLTNVNGEQIEYLTDIDTLKRTPDWTPGKQEPPKADGISIQSVTLSSIAYGADDIVRWHYEVAILPIVGGKTYFKDSGNFIVILMDGSIVEPMRTKG
jgi:hypothetical protein